MCIEYGNEFELQTCQFFKFESLNILIIIIFRKIFRPPQYIAARIIYIEADDGDRSAPWLFFTSRIGIDAQ